MRPLASSIDGLWSFEKAGTGVRITWSWTVRPASSATSLLMPAFGRMWQGYARQALEQLEGLLALLSRRRAGRLGGARIRVLTFPTHLGLWRSW